MTSPRNRYGLRERRRSEVGGAQSFARAFTRSLTHPLTLVLSHTNIRSYLTLHPHFPVPLGYFSQRQQSQFFAKSIIEAAGPGQNGQTSGQQTTTREQIRVSVSMHACMYVCMYVCMCIYV